MREFGTEDEFGNWSGLVAELHNKVSRVKHSNLILDKNNMNIMTHFHVSFFEQEAEEIHSLSRGLDHYMHYHHILTL